MIFIKKIQEKFEGLNTLLLIVYAFKIVRHIFLPFIFGTAFFELTIHTAMFAIYYFKHQIIGMINQENDLEKKNLYLKYYNYTYIAAFCILIAYLITDTTTLILYLLLKSYGISIQDIKDGLQTLMSE